MKKGLLLVLSMLFFASFSIAQEKTVTGTVTNEDGDTVPGVNVVVENTSVGTITNVDGEYSINVPDDGGTLIFSFIGLETQEVKVGNRSVVDVTMSTNVRQLTEIVVTGVGEATDKRKLGISVDAVEAKDLTEAPSGTIDQALIGRIAGAQIQSVSGQPGQQAQIILRGINTLGSTQPMIMIDGVQINTDNNPNGSNFNLSSRLADIDFSTVERIEVIQGAAAGTIYGAQGANGVIQIFTKKGQEGKTRIDVSSRVSFDNALAGNFGVANTHHFNTLSDGRIAAPDPLGGTDPVALRRQDNGIFLTPIGSVGPDTKSDNEFAEPTFDAVDQLFQDNAVTYNNSLTLSGGKDSFTFAITASNMNQESVIFGEFDRSSIRANLGFDLMENFTLNLGTNVITSSNTTGGITGANNVESALGSAVNNPQYIDLTFRDELGNYVANPTGDNSVNPFFNFENREYNAGVTRILQNINLNYKFDKFVELDYKYGIDHYRYDFEDLIRNQEQLLTGIISPLGGRLLRRLDKGTTQNSLITAFFRTNFEEDFNSSLPISTSTQVAFDWRREDFDRTEAIGTGLPAYENITLRASEEANVDEFVSDFVTYGYLVNQRIDYGELFGISGGFRLDWSSAFGQGSDPFFFPRGDVYFRVSELPAFSALENTISEFKIRAAYGEAGIQPNAFDRIVTLNAGQIGDNSYLDNRTTQTNPALGVQVSKEFEVGTDINLTLGQGAILPFAQISFTYWDRTSEDVIRAIEVAPSTGALSIIDNSFTLASNGIQASLNADIISRPGFKWNLLTNFTASETIIENIVNNEDIVLGNNFVLREGERVGTFFGLEPLTSFDQVDSDGERYIPESEVEDYEITSDGYVTNKTSRAVAFTTDQNVIGDPTPDFITTFINSFSFAKAFNLSFQFDIWQGFDLYNQTRQWLYRDLIHQDFSRPIEINGEASRWTNYYQSLYQTNQVNKHFVEDGSFVRLRDVSLSVDVTNLIQMRAFRNMRLSFSGRNLLTFTDYSGFDPEAASGLNNPDERGLDQYAFPNFRSYVVGLNIGF